MASSGNAAANISSAMSKLSLETSPPSKAQKAKKNTGVVAVADSWEDEAVSSDSEAGDDLASDHEQNPDQDGKKNSRGSSQAGTAAPPPTPMSPTYGSKRPFSPNTTTFDLPYNTEVANSAAGTAVPGKRPEKTDAVARRMIASALGVKVPKQTEEQKQYDRAIREKERRRREEEKELQRKKEEEAAKARQAVWED
ncbi:hypothetical protein OQA88_11925 [Cercophora sp. LCS_1]